ncbi:ABC transporter permease [Chthonobacter albigriseus]|uniref:ABC transporter permease n=1 Tax=Chthonobacter albigriseus TaxID=1683161 RepID=UPI0015EEDC28|nr:ABC transporter permease [Chthonobacter albigriseus]
MARLLAITIAIFVVMSLLKPGLFFTWGNFSSMAFQFPEFAILSLAMMIAMLTGGIDLSVIGLANLSAILAAFVLTAFGPDLAAGGSAFGVIALAVATALAIGAIGGLVNGLIIAVIGIPPILATLGTGLIFTGIAVVLTEGQAVLGFPAAFSVIGNGSIYGIPVPLVIFAVLAVAVAFLLNRTAFGLKLYLMGTNALASRFAGVDNTGLTVRAYLLSGTLASIAGVVLMSRANSAKADYGTSYLLLSILIAVLGGINPYGGFGKVGGLVLAVLSLQFLSSGFNMLQFSNFAKEFIWGALLLLVMVVNGLQFGRTRPRAAAREGGNP